MEDILGLFQVLTILYFTFNGQFCGQTDGMAMGSPPSPIIKNFYMEDYEKAALESAPLKLCSWFYYTDDMFVIWPHGPDKLKDFLHHLNSIHQSNQFTMETESEGHLPFLNLDNYRRPDGSLGHKVYRKPTHANHHLNAKSHHRPSNTQAVLSTLGHRARALCDDDSLQAKLGFFRDVSKQNGYNKEWYLLGCYAVWLL
jgi:hypothetical protein